MATHAASRQSDGPSLRPRIVDVSETGYATVTSMVGPDDTAYFERTPRETTLVIR